MRQEQMRARCPNNSAGGDTQAVVVDRAVVKEMELNLPEVDSSEENVECRIGVLPSS